MLFSDSHVFKSFSKALSQGISLWAGGAAPPSITLLTGDETEAQEGKEAVSAQLMVSSCIA